MRMRDAAHSCGAVAELHGIPVFIPSRGNHGGFQRTVSITYLLFFPSASEEKTAKTQKRQKETRK
jgi:hypothetical protein